jgi:hypothetical protein
MILAMRKSLTPCCKREHYLIILYTHIQITNSQTCLHNFSLETNYFNRHNYIVEWVDFEIFAKMIKLIPDYGVEINKKNLAYIMM